MLQSYRPATLHAGREQHTSSALLITIVKHSHITHACRSKCRRRPAEHLLISCMRGDGNGGGSQAAAAAGRWEHPVAFQPGLVA